MMSDRGTAAFCAFLGLLYAWTLAPAAGEATQRPGRPNVVLIMTDDQGYGDLGSHGNPNLKTPNLDRLASESIRFDDFHAAPYCIPSRASLMTGRYADRTGIHNAQNPHWFVRANEVLLSEMFRDAGYATGMFGKWHLGDVCPYGPEHRGFDEVLRHLGGAISVLNDYWDNGYADDTYYHNGTPTRVQGYCTDVFFDAATRFIRRSAEQGKPFFVYLPTNAPHGPYVCPPAYRKPYQAIRAPEITAFYGMIANIDENVGKLRAFLEETGQARNTIFIFTTDNGTGCGHRIHNAGMRGIKGSPYEGGHRVPLFVHWPEGGFAEERRIQTLTANIDIAPTLLDLCGIPSPEGVRFDGVSLRPLLEQKNAGEWPDRIIMTDCQFVAPPRKWVTTAVMSERWRLVNGRELYDIDIDPGQKANVYSEHPEVVQRMSAWYDTLWAEIEPTLRDVPEIPLGYSATESVTLNYHDSMNRHAFWFQDGIRNIKGIIDRPNGRRRPAYWPVNVVADGDYSIELRRWPRELDAAINAGVPPGRLVYGAHPYRGATGVGFPAVKARLTIGEQQFMEDVNGDAAGVTFRVKLSKGSQRLSARFIDAKGRSLDAFYVYVGTSGGMR